MTSKRRTSLEIGDLIGLVIECAKCTATLSIPFESLRTATPAKCPNCGSEWGFYNPQDNTTTAMRIQAAARALESLQKDLAAGGGFTLTLEVSPSAIAPD